MEAEEAGSKQAIARNLAAMSALTVPVVTVVTGEESSGGALALGVANTVLMLENAVYSILSPEGLPASCGRTPPAAAGVPAHGPDGSGAAGKRHGGSGDP